VWRAQITTHLEKIDAVKPQKHRFIRGEGKRSRPLPYTFDDFIIKHKAALPWNDSNFTAVLLEFRPLRAALQFSIDNVMNNLPVHWRIQVVGGASICLAVREIFPCEVEAGKILLIDLGFDKLSRVSGIIYS
jgi:hypothetical protein